MHPRLCLSQLKISSSHPGWLLPTSGCTMRHNTMVGWLRFLVWNMRLCVLICRSVSWIHLRIRHISLMPSPHRKSCLTTYTAISQNERLFKKYRCLIIVQIQTGVCPYNLQAWLVQKYLNLEHEFAIFCGTPPRPANTTRHTWHLHGPGGSWCPVLNSCFLLSIASGCYCGSMRVLANIWRPLLIAHRTCEPDQRYVAARRSNSSAINTA